MIKATLKNRSGFFKSVERTRKNKMQREINNTAAMMMVAVLSELLKIHLDNHTGRLAQVVMHK